MTFDEWWETVSLGEYSCEDRGSEGTARMGWDAAIQAEREKLQTELLGFLPRWRDSFRPETPQHSLAADMCYEVHKWLCNEWAGE